MTACMDVRLQVAPIPNEVSTNNSTTTPLAGGGTYAGTGEDITAYSEAVVNLAGSPQVCPGTLYFEFSPDNTNWDVSVPITVGDLAVQIPYPLNAVLPYFRVRYVNGSTAQSAMRLTTVYKRFAGPGLARTLSQVIGAHDPVTVTRAMIEPSPRGQRSILGADRAIFGSAVTASRITQLEADFSKTIAQNRVTSTVSGGGATAQSAGHATMTTGTATTASARLETTRDISYSPGNEVFAVFTARFTAPTHANSDQRAGLYDDNNGFFLGYDGLTFGFTVRKAGSDTFTAITSANGDPLNATFLSRFVRGGALEMFDPTKLNIFRIRFGWLGSSVCHFEIQNPDGEWMVIHTIRQANSATTPHIESPNLPIRMEAIKASADATSLVVGTGSWAAGITAHPYGLDESELHGREKVQASLENQTTDQTLYTVNSGRILKVRSVMLSAVNASTTTIGRIALRDGGSGGTIRLPVVIPGAVPAANTGFAAVNVTFPVPLDFDTDVYVDVLAGTLTYSISVIGYEEAE